jgi:hypothetical protein
MKKLIPIALSGIIMLSLSGCGYDGHYRYPCQDPVNWESAECKPPICTANGACPEDLTEIKEPING